MMRIELLTPQGDLVTSETYNKLFTIHGMLMVWFFLIPSIPAVLGNFVLPMMIGARDVAFPETESVELVFVHRRRLAGALVAHSLAAWIPAGPFTRPTARTYANSHVITMAAGVFIAGFSPSSPG